MFCFAKMCFGLLQGIQAGPEVFWPVLAWSYAWQPLQGPDMDYWFIKVWNQSLSVYFPMFEVFCFEKNVFWSIASYIQVLVNQQKQTSREHHYL